MASTTRIARQLRALLSLTQAEAQVARIRIAQARNEEVATRLERIADAADERVTEITAELRHLGGVADVVSPAVGRASALVKGTLEQAGPLDEGLLGDLTLQHRLRDRAVYLRALARSAEVPRVERLADRLVVAHGETIDWLTTVLAEYALDGPAALRPTPFQLVAGGAAQVLALPARVARDQLSRWAQRLSDGGDEVRDTVRDGAQQAARFAVDARDVVVTGRDAALDRAEELSRSSGAADTAEALRGARTRLGALNPSELPITDYDGLGADEAASAVAGLGKVADINAVLAYEEAHRDRRTVVSAARTRHANLAREVVGVG